MGQAISEVLTFAVGVAISPVPIIAVVLMLFSSHAKVNGPMFLVGWAVALAVVSGVGYLIADAGNGSTDSTAADAVAWTQILFGAAFLLLAGRLAIIWALPCGGRGARDPIREVAALVC